MISLPIRDKSGNDVGSYEFDPGELASGVNKQLLHEIVVMYEANRRIDTVTTKSRGMVAGSTAKMYRQKGTGRARAGGRRTPVRRGGGHAFGKVPKDWSFRLPKRAIKAATRMALLSKFLDNEATVLDELTIEEPKTKVLADLLKALGLSADSCLLAIDQHDPNVWKSARNIQSLQVAPVNGLNAYALLHQKRLLVTKSALDRLRGQSAGNGESAGDAE